MPVEEVSPLERKISFNVNKAVVNGHVANELKKYAKKAKVQGFRPGKAPKHIVEQMYGGQAYEDALNQQINKQLAEQLVAGKLNMVGHPKIDLTSSEGEDFTFAATFEVMPEIVIGDLSNQEIEQPLCTLTDQNVETTIEILCKQRANYIETNSEAATGDRVTIDFLGKVDGEEFAGGKAENYSFELGQGRMLADFEAGIFGMKPEATKDVTVNFPESYHAENLKGKTAIFTISLKTVAKQQLPELTPEFIKTLGVNDGSEDSLRQEIKDNLQREVARRLRIKSRDNALQALAEVSPLTVPNALVHDEIHQMMKNAEENMKRQGYKPTQIKLTHEMFEQDARKMVTLRLLVQEFIRQNSITSTAEEMKAIVEEMASMYEDPVEYVNWYFEDKQRLNNAMAMAIERKVTEAIYAKAKTKEVVLSYEDVMKMQVQ